MLINKTLQKLNLSLFLFLVNIIVLIIFLPIAPSFAYGPHHYANLFLPNFGLNSEVSTLPHAAKSLLTSYSFNKIILLLVVDNDIVRLHQLTYVLSKVLIISAYFLILNDITSSRSISAILCLFLSLLIDWPAIPLSLIVIFIYSLLSINDKKRYLIGMLSYTTLSFYWHSASMIGLSIFIGYLMVLILFKSLRYSNTTDFLVTPILITIFSWAFIRGLNLGMAFHNMLTMLQTFSVESLKMGLFSKGAFIPKECVFNSNFPISVNIIDRMRYISYIIIYIFSALIFIDTIKKRHISKFNMLFLMALIGDILFKILYFGATRTVPPVVPMILLYPMTILYLVSKINKPLNVQNRLLSYILLTFLMISFLLSSQSSYYTETFEDTQGTTPFEIYMPSIFWTSQYTSNNTNIITDGNTGGYYQIIYTKQELYNHSKIRIFKSGLTYRLYKEIYTGSYKNNKDSILVVNLEIIKKHLRVVSLQAWNRFKPIPLDRIVNNNLSVIYNDNRFMILK